MRKILFSLLLLIFCLSGAYAQSDSLLMSNGDMIVGEIKQLVRGVLIIETDYSDKDLQIEWNKVRKINTSGYFIISLTDGTRLNGRILSDPTESGKAIIPQGMALLSVDLEQIVFLKALEKDFLGRLDASLDLGINISKANNLRQLNTRSNVAYMGNSWGAEGSLDIVRSRQDSINDTKRTDAFAGFRLLMNNSWYTVISGTFLQNDEQKLKLRSSTNLSAGKFFINTNRVYLAASGGFAWTNEQYTEASQSTKNSLEALIASELNLFDLEDLSLLTRASLYPGITEKGRIRLDFKIDLKYDLPLEFYIRLGYTHNFDNQPAADAAPHDYVFQLSIGWEL